MSPTPYDRPGAAMHFTAGPGPESHPDGGLAQRAAWIFYGIAAAGSLIGQIWVGVQSPPWPEELAWWWRALLVWPFAFVVDLGGVVTSAMADFRRRLGETAYGWRLLSAGSVTVGVTVNIVGHRDLPLLAVVFGGLGVFAYLVWLLHAAARRRDALRAAGKLPQTAPVYGIAQWGREPAVTRRARALALELGYSRQQSLDVARQQLRAEARRAALGSHVEELIRSRHDDPIRAAIAVTTLDIDAIAAALTAQTDVDGWAHAIGADLVAPPPVEDTNADADSSTGAAAGSGPMPPADVLRRVPQDPTGYAKWRELWGELRADLRVTNAEFAARHGISLRQVQWIRRVGASGLIESPVPLMERIAQLPTANGHPPQDAHPPTP